MSQQNTTAHIAAAASSIALNASPSAASEKAKTNVNNPYAVKNGMVLASIEPTAPMAQNGPASTSINPTAPMAHPARDSFYSRAQLAPISNPYNYNTSTSRKRTLGQEHKSPTATQKCPPPPPANEFTTFSQAFGDADLDAQFGEDERAQQLVFDQSMAPATTNGDFEPLNKNSTDGITPRDQQTMLQPHCLHISTRQRGNPIIEHIRNVPFKYSAMVPDYIMAPTRCALFLSLRYHNLHPNYIHRRIAELKSDFEYRMLLCYVDIEDNTSPILFLNDMCVQNNFTLILAWSEEEAARYLETVKAFDGKDPTTVIGKHEPKTHQEKLIHALGSIPSVNRTDVSVLLTQFGSFQHLVAASIDELGVCPGVGPKKVRRLYEAFHRPFSTESAAKKKGQESDKKEIELK
jgi:DNA excision repair protein ERCC-1